MLASDPDFMFESIHDKGFAIEGAMAANRRRITRPEGYLT